MAEHTPEDLERLVDFARSVVADLDSCDDKLPRYAEMQRRGEEALTPFDHVGAPAKTTGGGE